VTTLTSPSGWLKQFGLIDLAVAPLEHPPGAMEPGRIIQLKHDLAVIMSAEALFTLTDLAGLAPQDAIASVTRAARTITEAAMQSPAPASGHPLTGDARPAPHPARQ
jgi:hypothetical protein